MTGRPVTRERCATTISWLKGSDFAAEAAAVGRRDDADPRGRHLEHLRERAVDVVRRLRRGPERELPVGAEIRERRVLLERADAVLPS